MTGTANAVNGPEAAPYVAKAGGTMTGALILNTSSPSTDLQAASKGYVDAIAQGLNVLPAAYAATTGALTATYANGAGGIGATLTNSGAMAAFSVDGVSPPINSRILVKNQGTTFENGVYTLTTVGSGAVNWVLTRATDYDQPAEINPGDFILIDFGTTNSSTGWIQTATVTTIGVDAISFSQFGASFPLSLSNGGTGKALTANNGGIVWTDADSMEILAGTATAGLALLSGSTATPSWSTGKPVTQVATQIFTSNGTYTPTTGATFIMVELVGGGASGGGASASGAGNGSAGGGGSAAGYCRKLYTAALIGANAAVVIGAGGTAPSAGANPGNDGNDSTFTPAGAGAVLTAAKGIGGSAGTSSAAANVSAISSQGGIGTNGDINIRGQRGSGGFCLATATLGQAGMGGNSPIYGLGGTPNTNTSSSGGVGATGYGAGGDGGLALGAGGDRAGAAGQPGICIVTEFISV